MKLTNFKTCASATGMSLMLSIGAFAVDQDQGVPLQKEKAVRSKSIDQGRPLQADPLARVEARLAAQGAVVVEDCHAQPGKQEKQEKQEKEVLKEKAVPHCAQLDAPLALVKVVAKEAPVQHEVKACEQGLDKPARKGSVVAQHGQAQDLDGQHSRHASQDIGAAAALACAHPHGAAADDDSSSSDSDHDDGQLSALSDLCISSETVFVQRDKAMATVFNKKQVKGAKGLSDAILTGDFGHRWVTGSLIGRTYKWNKFHFHNVAMDNIHAGAANARESIWTNFEIAGSVYGWDLQGSRLQNGRFSGILEGVNFNQAYLRNVVFSSVRLDDAHRKNTKTTFRDATIDGVVFDNVELDNVDFTGAIFTGNTVFRNFKVDHIGSTFKHAKIKLKSGEFVVIDTKIAHQMTQDLHAGSHLAFTHNNIHRWMNAR